MKYMVAFVANMCAHTAHYSRYRRSTLYLSTLPHWQQQLALTASGMVDAGDVPRYVKCLVLKYVTRKTLIPYSNVLYDLRSTYGYAEDFRGEHTSPTRYRALEYTNCHGKKTHRSKRGTSEIMTLRTIVCNYLILVEEPYLAGSSRGIIPRTQQYLPGK